MPPPPKRPSPAPSPPQPAHLPEDDPIRVDVTLLVVRLRAQNLCRWTGGWQVDRGWQVEADIGDGGGHKGQTRRPAATNKAGQASGQAGGRQAGVVEEQVRAPVAAPLQQQSIVGQWLIGDGATDLVPSTLACQLGSSYSTWWTAAHGTTQSRTPAAARLMRGAKVGVLAGCLVGWWGLQQS